MAADSEAVSPSVYGTVMAVVISLINGSACVLQKKGILRSREKKGILRSREKGRPTEDGPPYADVVWWTGTAAMVVGQSGNVLIHNLVPAVLVTPLGALGVLFGAVLASWLLKEPLNLQGKLGCVLCCCGSVLLIVHAPKHGGPQAPALTSSLQLEERLLDPVFVVYALVVLLLLLILILWIAPAHGSSNITVYVAICSLLGSFTVPCCKGLGVVYKEAIGEAFGAGPSSGRALALFLGLLGTLAASITIQFIFIQKALGCFSARKFEALYYVTFTCSVILATALLFKEWDALTRRDSLAILGALTIMCVGVILLCISQEASKRKTD